MAKAAVAGSVDKIRQKAEADLFYFMKLVNPSYVYGKVHKDVCDWLTSGVGAGNKLALLPRAHLKSHIAANYAVWLLTRRPETTILYLSATATLAEAQLLAIKGVLTSEIYKLFWPDMVRDKEGERARWNTTEIIVDHPARADNGVRDASISTGGITKNITGLHADAIFLDDMVVPDNAYTEEGRRKVQAIYSQLASIKNPGCPTIAVGTRYHPKDLYSSLIDMQYSVVDDATGEVLGQAPVYDVLEHVVETDGVFLWPRERAANGEFYGFSHSVLQKIYAEYLDKTQFHSQYYNNPNDPESNRVSRDSFKYYDKKHLSQTNGTWFFKDRRLNVYAAVDFAFSLARRADNTAIVVIGIDSENNIYVLDIARFKTDSIKVYYDNILELYKKWEFRKIRAECNAAQGAVVKELRRAYVAPNGLALTIEEHTVTRHQGTKEERVASVLEPRYANGNIWHYKGGYCEMLEEEVIQARPPHDDIKDALAAAVETAIAPTVDRKKKDNNVVMFSSRFGGVSYR